MPGYAGSRDYVGNLHRTLNEGVGVCHDRVGNIFFRGGLGSVWGSSRGLQVPYVIPRPGVIPRHIEVELNVKKKCLMS